MSLTFKQLVLGWTLRFYFWLLQHDSGVLIGDGRELFHSDLLNHVWIIWNANSYENISGQQLDNFAFKLIHISSLWSSVSPLLQWLPGQHIASLMQRFLRFLHWRQTPRDRKQNSSSPHSSSPSQIKGCWRWTNTVRPPNTQKDTRWSVRVRSSYLRCVNGEVLAAAVDG